jgi:hypothetical protein
MSKDNRVELVARTIGDHVVMVEVSRSSKQYTAEWFCHKLGVSGSSSRSFPTIEDAIAGALTNAQSSGQIHP